MRKALHIPDYVQAFPENAINFTIQSLYQWHYEGSGWIQGILHRYGYRTVHLFGSTDGQCTQYGVRKWIKEGMKWKVTKEWAPYFTKDD